jgi:cytochrome c556
MPRITTVRLAFICAGAAAVLSGCDQKPASVQQAAASSTATSPEASRPAVKPPFSVNEMMVMIVDQPGERLWDVEKGGAPKTTEDWYRLENHAVALASAATLIQLGGTGPNDMVWSAQPEWRASADHLVSASLQARDAARAKDMAALVKANGVIVDACQSCHDKYKPDIPTGGLFIHKRPGDKS